MNYAKKLLAEVGLAPERLEIYFLSSAEGVRFAEIATEMTDRARQLGPNPLKNGQELKARLDGEDQNATTD